MTQLEIWKKADESIRAQIECTYLDAITNVYTHNDAEYIKSRLADIEKKAEKLMEKMTPREKLLDKLHPID